MDKEKEEKRIRKAIYGYRDQINLNASIIMRRDVPIWEKEICKECIRMDKQEIKALQQQLKWLKRGRNN